jgi:exodeoxyribonuclease III
MLVMTLNLNGIRSAHTKGTFAWLERQNADIILLQEVRALEHQLPDLGLLGYRAFWNPAQKAGYSGVGILSKVAPKRVTAGINSSEFDLEGRVLRAEFENFDVVSAYIPSGSSGVDRQAAKMRFLAEFLAYLEGLRLAGRELIVGGDFNIAHRKVDLKNWRSNQNQSGFLPEDRAWVDSLLELGWIDTFRHLVGADAEHYSWWSARGNARANNVGWRLDYQFSTPKLAATASNPRIHTQDLFSDHAPVMLEYGL